jgi:predicted chitinase
VQVTIEQLLAIMPRCPYLRAAGLLAHLNAALAEFEIDTPWRAATFLAQLAHESVELRHFEELADGKAYEGRKDLGNTEKGDGPRYKGRGPIQLTGRANYRRASTALGLDLEGDPRRASDADVGFRVAGWFWKSHGLNELADRQDFDAITRKINGGTNGAASRRAYLARALSAFAIRI